MNEVESKRKAIIESITHAKPEREWYAGGESMRSEREILIDNITLLLKYASLRDLKFIFTYVSNCPKEDNHDEKNS